MALPPRKLWICVDERESAESAAKNRGKTGHRWWSKGKKRMLSTESYESTQMLTGFKRKTPDNRDWECSATLSVEVIEVIRRSYEHLVESEEATGRELAFPALTEDERLFWNTERQHTSMAASKTKASAELHSPAPSLALTPYVTNMAFSFSEGHLSTRHSVHEVDISTRRILCIDRCSPLPKAALTLPKSMPISSLRALPARPDKDTPPPSLRELLTLGTLNGVKTCKERDRTTNQVIEDRTASLL